MHHYPFQSETYFPRNVWYIGARSDEVGEALLGRTFFDERVLLYRKMDGEVTALSGLCPHRFLPLEHGVRIGDRVQCGYHGITFDETGACVRIPSQDEVPERCHLRTYPTLEAGGFVWIWMGNPAGASEDLMPDLEAAGLQGDGWKVTPNKVWHIEGRAQLVVDNLFDLSHVPFAHATAAEFLTDHAPPPDYETFDPGFQSPLKVGQRNGRLTAWREVEDTVPAPSLGMLFSHIRSPRVTYHVGTQMLSPALINAGYMDVWGKGDDTPARINFVHGVTPETATSTHMFLSTTRNYMTDSEEMCGLVRTMNLGIVSQDVAIYNAIEPHLAGLTTKDEVTVTADAGAVQARRLLQKMMAQEQSQPVTS